MSRPFADSVVDYAQAGWPCIIPVPPADKYPPPVGFTGAAGRDTEPLQLVQWASSHGDWSVALRMPDGVIGIDVDHYVKGSVDKRGADTLAEREAAWGALPATWTSTARGSDTGPGPSRILFYRVPAGRYATKLGENIDVIQRHHRYAVVWPSPHEVGNLYRWYGPDGLPATGVPKPVELPELPAPWVAGLREGATETGPAAAGEAAGRMLLAELLADERAACAEMASAAENSRVLLARATTGGRHDTATERTHHLVQLGAAGHPGAGAALGALSACWEQLTAGEHRADEFARMMLTSARKAVTVVGARPVDRDPCLVIGSVPMAAPAPADDRPGEDQPEPIEPPRQLHPLEIIGAHPFDPRGHLDQTMADAVLARTQPILRYAHDARLWLLRGPEVWVSRTELEEWAVALLADLMPHGNPDGEKGSEARDQAERRKRFMSAGPAGAFSKKIRARVRGGAHPSTLAITDLDREPWLLWAGGVGWDLRASREVPTAARIDPATPHRHSAAVAPDVRPTPLWDAFTAAVWPDPELRAWALRVLSIALTGYSDKALPILVGERDRGKTQVIALLMSVLGTYAHAADPRLLGSEVAKTHASIVYALMGRRLSFIDEGPREGRIAEERLKQLTGGGELTANAMNKDPVTWAPTHTLVLTANDEPVLTDPAVRARVRLIPCEGDPERVIATRTAIGHPSERAWRIEAPGVLAAMMREAGMWLAEPSSALTSAAPEAYRYRAEEIAAEQDPIAQWLDDATEPDASGERSRALYEAFVVWARNGALAPGRLPSETRWGRELTRRGYPAVHTRTGKRRALRLRQHGWPGSVGPIVPAVVTGELPCDGLAPSGDGLVTGSPVNPSRVEPQAEPVTTDSVTGVTGSIPFSSHAHAHTRTHAHEARPQNGSHPSHQSRPVTLPAGEAKEAARARAILEAAGAAVPLPAVVDRTGAAVAVTLPVAGAELAAVIERAGGALTVDVETSGYPVGHADHELRTVQLGDAQRAVVFAATDPAQADMARIALAAAPRLHAHSATADLVPLAAAGLLDESAWDRMHDTVIPAKLADPGSTGSDPGLKQLAPAVLRANAVTPTADAARAALFKAARWLTDIGPTTPRERSGWAQVDPACTTMVRYAAADVLDTAALAVRLPTLPAEVIERERAVQRITARVTHRGLRIDGEQVDHLRETHGAALAIADERVTAFGIDNAGSDRQVAAALIARGVVLPYTKPSARHPNGQPSVAAGVLDALRGTSGEAGALVDAVLEYRHHETVLSTFLEPYRQLVIRGDGRARPTIYTLGTDTGRMSCVRPNLQQLPRQGGVRACITADPGQLLISADFSSMELRVAAALSGDAELARMIAEGVDLHGVIAREVWGPGWTKADRYAVKRLVFGRLYGGGVPACARGAGVSESVAASAVDVLDAVTPGLTAWSRGLRDAVKRGATQFPTAGGRVIWLTRDYPHKAPNYAIQGTARELLVDALLRWSTTPWGGGVVLPVHDEILAAVPAAQAGQATRALVECMTSELYGVPIAAEPSAPAYAWQDAV